MRAKASSSARRRKPAPLHSTKVGTPAAAPVTIDLPEELGIDQVSALHAQLIDVLDVPDPVQFDGEKVQRIHTAALQLFCCFCSDRGRQGRGFGWQRPSESLRRAAALLGMTTLLQMAGEAT
jgi:ABC-type transporter Mla MlaB component